jgi:hypothetical protein
MTVVRFPARAPFHITVKQTDGEWWVVCRSHGRIHHDLRSAVEDARWLGANHGAAVVLATATAT